MPINELPIPEGASRTPNADEILRVFINSDKNMDLLLRPVFPEPASWGRLIVDIARHAASSYGDKGMDTRQAFAAMRQAAEAEWNSPPPPGMQTKRVEF